MECLFAPELEYNKKEVLLPPDELAHAKALRLRSGEQILLTNTRGLCARAVVDIADKFFVCKIIELLPEFNEQKISIHLALGILDNRDRWEFALEKATELGIREITPLATMFSQRQTINQQRTKAKILAAVKQAQRAYLPVLHESISVRNFLLQLNPATLLVVADSKGSKPTIMLHSSVTIIVGPEGGFSPDEQRLFTECSHNNQVSWSFAPARLRAETAAISAVALVSGMSVKNV